MKWIITGGTGFIGTKLVAALRARQDDVTVFSRRAAPERGVVAWTPEENGPWMDAIDGVDTVVHLAGAGIFDARWSEARMQEIRESRVRTTKLVAEAILRAKKKPRVLVSGSAVGIYGMRKDDAVLTENSPPGDDVLARLCVDWEDAAAPAREGGTRVVHPRTGIVLGTEGGFLSKMLPPFRAFVGGPVGDGTQWVSWVHVDDAVRALLFAAENAIDGPFNVTAPAPATMNDLAATLGSVLHRPSVLRVPPFALRLAMGAEMAEAALTGQRALPTKLEGAGFAFHFPDLRAALQNLLVPG